MFRNVILDKPIIRKSFAGLRLRYPLPEPKRLIPNHELAEGRTGLRGAHDRPVEADEIGIGAVDDLPFCKPAYRTQRKDVEQRT